MNTFYTEQKVLMEKAVNLLYMIESLDEIIKEVNEKTNYPSKIAEAAGEKWKTEKLESLKTDYALTVTTLMQNFCAQMGIYVDEIS